jgi:phage terminase large subunit-like protein
MMLRMGKSKLDVAAARKHPNGPISLALWDEMMERFKGGDSDATLARAYGVSQQAVAQQRWKRGIFRADYPVRGPKAPVAPPPERAAAGGKGRKRAATAPSFVPPRTENPAVCAEAMLTHGQRLVGLGWRRDGEAFMRMARLGLMTLGSSERLPSRRGKVGGFTPMLEAGAAPAAANDDGRARVTLRTAQRAPEGDWRTWLFLGGRGAGKTLAGAAWLAEEAKRVGRLALVGPTLHDVRSVMIDGPSGLRGAAAAFAPKGEAPVFEPSLRRLRFANGAEALVFSAEDPDSLRGPQFAAAWGDELCAWARPGEVLAQLRMGLRLGGAPRLAVTTTPRPSGALRALLAETGLAVTRGSAAENAAWLAPGFLERLRGLYGGTRLERQELDGEVLEALEGAVFRRTEVERARRLGAEGPRPQAFDRLVVGVDPPAGLDGAACGIVVAGRVGRNAWVLEDATVQGLSPSGWAGRVVAAVARAEGLGPVQVTAEANQGGEMVRAVLAQAGLEGRVRLVRASSGKAARAEPVALLYEQGRVAHAGALEALEDQLLLLGAERERGGGGGSASPDRADALVWALTALLLEPGGEGPRVWVPDWPVVRTGLSGV